MSVLDPKAFAESTQFYNVAKDVYISLQDVLVPGLKPKEFREHINAIKQPRQSNDPQSIMILQLLTFLAEVEKAMRHAAKYEEVDLPAILTNEQAYPLFIWAIGMNVTVNDNRIVTTGGNGIILSVADAPGAVLNASVVSNRVGGAATIVSGTVSTVNGNILLDSVGWTFDATTGVVNPGQGILNIRAANEANLQGLNFSTSVQDLPADVIDAAGNILIPPPPFYDPALSVPLPPN
jgi:hypothetical protein